MAKMQFEYSAAPQRSPEWFALRLGKVSASRLVDWMAVSKSVKTPGAPLKPRMDYEKELMFERQFGRSFDKWFSDAMQDGVDYEDFGRKQYEQITGNTTEEVGCWYNDYFVASPDRVVGEEGLLEIKILKDNSFVEVLTEGVPDKHWKQIQGQLFASKRAWCDYVAVNLNTKKVVIIRVYPDADFHEWLELIIPEKLVTTEFDTNVVHDIVGEVPSWEGANEVKITGSDAAFKKGW